MRMWIGFIEINIIDIFNNIDRISQVSTMTTEEYV
jgi:hypothetical protein